MISSLSKVGNGMDLYPNNAKDEVDATNIWIHEMINNGVYRAGFSTSQGAFDRACKDVGEGLERADQLLKERKYLNGEDVTESDVFLFPTAIRFDAVYATLFRCGGKRGRLASYEHLKRWLNDFYRIEGVASTFDLEEIKRSYYTQLFPLNPSGLVPTEPTLKDIVDLSKLTDKVKAKIINERIN
mmetsp:Transcript_11240/g.16737  ORF Transcript_11240/g.16737 Transcript_11240/m.16737 type:complete len:185 (+) Transcript_11240:1-555(+)